MNIAGHKITPPVAIAGVAGVGIVFYLYKKNSASSSSSSAIDPVTGLPVSMDGQIDPVTGLAYLAEAQQYGSVSAAEAQAANAGLALPGSNTSGYVGTAGNTATGTPYSTTSTSFSTNAAWAQAAQAGLTQVGYDPTTVGNALGAYLNRQPLTPDQAAIVQAAVAEFGPPPVGQFSIIPQGTSSGPGPGGTVTGAGGPITATVSGLHVTHVYTNSAQVAWNSLHVPAGQGPLTGYGVEAFDSHGHRVNGPFTTKNTVANIGGLKTKTTYHVNVWADPAKTGGPHATATFTTK